jgi:hypothetical protein
MTTKLKKIPARYPGTCVNCGGSIEQGEQILWARGHGAEHVDCKGRYDEEAHAESTAFSQMETAREVHYDSPESHGMGGGDPDPGYG